MPFDSELFLKIEQFEALLNILERQTIIEPFEKETISDGKNPPPRPPPSKPLTQPEFIALLAAREGVVIVGGPP